MAAYVTPNHADTESSNTPSAPYTSAQRSRVGRLLSRNRAPPDPSAVAEAFDASTAPEGSEVQIAVFLAMPTQQKMSEGVPDLVIATSKIPLRPGPEGDS